MTTLSAMPGSNRIGPNPVSSPSPTQPPQMDTNAPRAINTSGHDPSRDRVGVGASTAVLTGTDTGSAGVATSDGAGGVSADPVVLDAAAVEPLSPSAGAS